MSGDGVSGDVVSGDMAKWRRRFIEVMAFMRERPHGRWRRRCLMLRGNVLMVPGVLSPGRQRILDLQHRLVANNNARRGEVR